MRIGELIELLKKQEQQEGNVKVFYINSEFETEIERVTKNTLHDGEVIVIIQ